MEFRLDDGQVELQRTVARLFADRFPLDTVGSREDAPVDRAAWADLTALGIPGLLLAGDGGGSGLGAVEAALVFEQVGSHLVPGPLLWAVLAAPLVDGVASGERLVGGVVAADVGPAGAVIVEHAADLDVLLVVHDDRVVAHDLAEVGRPERLEPLDPLTPVGTVSRLSAFKVPTRWLLTTDVSDIPMTATGKVDKAALRERLRHEHRTGDTGART